MSTERSIPHLRDIFGLSINHKNQEPVYTHPPPNADILVEKSSKKNKKSTKNSANGQQNGGGELKTLERHLSMKKTIRKKIMRDLQQAFVDDPNEFTVDNNQERMKSELNLEAMRYGDNKQSKTRKSDNFLDMLRGDQNANGMNYNNNIHNSHIREAQHQQVQQSQPPYRRHEHNGEENYPDILPTHNHGNNNEKQSFWSRFGIRNKNKR